MPFLIDRDMKAAEVCGQLMKWLYTIENLSVIYSAVLTVTDTYVAIEIGEWTVWESENYDEEELTFEHCKSEFQAKIRKLLPYLESA